MTIYLKKISDIKLKGDCCIKCEGTNYPSLCSSTNCRPVDFYLEKGTIEDYDITFEDINENFDNTNKKEIVELISPSLIKKLNEIYNYFGSGSKTESYDNKIRRLFLEAGEYRDTLILNLHNKNWIKEICDILSCCLQLYYNNPEIQIKFEEVLDFTLERINAGYYAENNKK